MGLRHRLYGFDCPAVDVDFLLVEYSSNRAVAIIEYKHRIAGEERKEWSGNLVPRILFKSAILTLRALAKRARMPFFVAFYDDEDWRYEVYELFDGKTYCMKKYDFTELEFVRLLYKLRGMKMPEGLDGKLHS